MDIRKIITDMYDDQIGDCGRKPHMLVIDPRDGSVVIFTGQSIPKLVAVAGSDYHKDGKWSHTTFRFRFGTGVVAVRVQSALHQGALDRFDSWDAVCSAISDVAGVSFVGDSMVAAIRACFPKSSAALDDRISAIGDLI